MGVGASVWVKNSRWLVLCRKNGQGWGDGGFTQNL